MQDDDIGTETRTKETISRNVYRNPKCVINISFVMTTIRPRPPHHHHHTTTFWQERQKDELSRRDSCFWKVTLWLSSRRVKGQMGLCCSMPSQSGLSWVLGTWVVCCVWLPVPSLVFLIDSLVGVVLDRSLNTVLPFWRLASKTQSPQLCLQFQNSSAPHWLLSYTPTPQQRGKPDIKQNVCLSVVIL